MGLGKEKVIGIRGFYILCAHASKYAFQLVGWLCLSSLSMLALDSIHLSIVESLSVESFHKIERYSLKSEVLITRLFCKIKIIQV